MTKHLDDCVGRLLDALKKLGIEENTIVVFTSDNGSHAPELTHNPDYALEQNHLNREKAVR